LLIALILGLRSVVLLRENNRGRECKDRKQQQGKPFEKLWTL
jgi:hypothetical protein